MSSWTNTNYSSTQGTTSTITSLDNTRRLYNFGDRVAEIEPQEAIFMSYLYKNRKVFTDDPIFKLLEQRHQWQRRNFYLGEAIASATYTSGATYVNDDATGVGNDDDNVKIYCLYDRYGREQTAEYRPEFFVTGQIVAIKDTDGTPRRFRVSALPSVTSGAGTVDVELLALFSATCAFADDAEGQVIGSAFAENTGAPEGWKDELYDREGYTQIFKTSCPIFSGTSQATRYRGRPNEMLRVWHEKLKEHKMDMEHSAMFGYGAVGGGATIQYSWGILPFTELYGKSYTFNWGDFKYDNFLDAMEDFFAPESGNSSDKLVLASRKVLNRMNKLGEGGFLYNTVGSSQYRMDIQNVKGQFGHIITRVNTIFGNLHFMQAPLLRNMWEDYAIAIDLKNVAWRPLKANGVNRDTFIKTNVQENDIDGRKDLITTEAGLEVNLPETHAVMKWS